MIVSRGLGLPESGLIVAGGLGISDGSGVVIGHLSAVLAGAGEVAGELTALGHLNTLLVGSGEITGNVSALAHLEAVLSGSGTLTASATQISDLVAILHGSGGIIDADLTERVLDAAMRILSPSAEINVGSPSAMLVIYAAEADIGLVAWNRCCADMFGAFLAVRSPSAALSVQAATVAVEAEVVG